MQSNKENRALIHFGAAGIYALMALMLCGAAVLGYWSWWQGPPIRAVGVEMLTPELKRGQTGRVLYVTYKTRNCAGKAEAVFQDANGRLTFWQTNSAGLLPPGETRGIYSFQVPENAAFGPATYWRVLTYSCNPVFPTVVQLPPAEFQVIP